MSPYYKVKSKEWIAPIRKGYKMECCDCGLVHVVNFRINKKTKKIELQMVRHNRATGQLRRYSPIFNALKEAHLMLRVLRTCIDTKVFPIKKSPCYKRINKILRSLKKYI